MLGDFLSFLESHKPQNNDQPVPIGGFYVAQVNVSPLFEAAENKPSVVTKIPILFDNDDIKFLLQFHPTNWAKALRWRYSHGLMKARDHYLEDNDSSTIPEQGKVNVGTDSNPETYRGVNLYLREMFKKLIKSRDDNGMYAFDLLEPWYKKEVSHKKAGKVVSELQWHVGNYVPMIDTTAYGCIQNWFEGTTAGFLGKNPNAKFEKFESEGRSSKEVLVNWDNQVLNMSAGKVRPVCSNKALMDNFDSSMIVDLKDKKGNLIAEGEGIQYKVYVKDGSLKPTPPTRVPLLLPGRAFNEGNLNPYKQYLKGINELFQNHIAKTSLAGKSIIDPKEIIHHLPPMEAKQFQDWMGGISRVLPDSGTEHAIKPVNLVDYDAYRRKNDRGENGKLASFGRFDTTHNSQSEENISNKILGELNLTRPEYEALIIKHFVEDAPKSRTVVNGLGQKVETPIPNAVNQSVNAINKGNNQFNPRQQEQLVAEAPFIMPLMKTQVLTISGIGKFIDFIKAEKQGFPPEQKQKLWEKAVDVVNNKAFKIVGIVNQFDLGEGTRRKRGRVSSGQGGDDVTLSPLDLATGRERGVGKAGRGEFTGRGQSARNSDFDNPEQRYLFRSNVHGLLDVAKHLGTIESDLEKSRSEDLDAQIQSIHNASLIMQEYLHLYFLKALDEQKKQGQQFDFDGAYTLAVKQVNTALAGSNFSSMVPKALSPEEKQSAEADMENEDVMEKARGLQAPKQQAPSLADYNAQKQMAAQSQQLQQQPPAVNQPQAAGPTVAKPATQSKIFTPALEISTPKQLRMYFNSPEFQKQLASDPNEILHAKHFQQELAKKAPNAAMILGSVISSAEEQQKKVG